MNHEARSMLLRTPVGNASSRKEHETEMEELLLRVPGMSCDHCVAAVRREIAELPGVAEVEVDLPSKRVVVHGRDIDPIAVRGAVLDAGYEPED